jgi:hypothetical protein
MKNKITFMPNKSDDAQQMRLCVNDERTNIVVRSKAFGNFKWSLYRTLPNSELLQWYVPCEVYETWGDLKKSLNNNLSKFIEQGRLTKYDGSPITHEKGGESRTGVSR